MAKKVDMEFANFDANISIENPIADYTKLLDDKMKADVIMPQEVYNACWAKISAAAREIVWKLLFDLNKPAEASDLLKFHKEDACFYQAAEYNKWIVLVRDELLKRKMFDFWKNEIVQKELGLCWARDSDLFDDTDDPEPENFYKYADCEAPWLKKKQKTEAQNAADLVASSLLSSETPITDKTLKKLTIESAADDYKYNMEILGEIAEDDYEEVYKDMFAEARKMVWQLLFGETTLTEENSKKAADLLEEYKRDACFFSPFDYNDWIPEVKKELIKRKYFDFWENVIVQLQLGLCWAADSDYFDDMDDPIPPAFYKIDESVKK